MLVEKFECFEKKLDTMLAKQPMALQVERRLGHPKTRLAMYVVLLFLSLILFYLNGDLAHALVAVLLPGFASARYLYNHHVHKGNEEEATVSLWMTYWLVLGKLLVLEAMGLMRMVPMYGFVRIAFLVWLQAPGLEGARLVLDKAMLPVFDVLFAPSPNGGLKPAASASSLLSNSKSNKGNTNPKSPKNEND